MQIRADLSEAGFPGRSTGLGCRGRGFWDDRRDTEWTAGSECGFLRHKGFTILSTNMTRAGLAFSAM